MLDLFTIFSKGGIVLWYFQGTSQLFTNSVNELIKNVMLQERGVSTAWNHNTLSLQYKLDNEFELVFVVAYQNILKLTYIDKFLTEMQLRFRDKYKQHIQSKQLNHDFSDFEEDFNEILKMCESEAKLKAQTSQGPKSYNESAKSSKTVSSMIEKKSGFLGNFMSNEPAKEKPKAAPKSNEPVNQVVDDAKNNENSMSDDAYSSLVTESKMKKLINSGGRPRKFEPKKKANVEKPTPTSPRKGKAGTKWDDGGHKGPLDYGDKSPPTEATSQDADLDKYASKSDVGKYKGDLRGIEVRESSDDDEAPLKTITNKSPTNGHHVRSTNSKSKSSGGIFSSLKSLVGAKVLTEEMITPVMEKMQEHLVSKNVASEIAQKVCNNVAQSLEGKQISSFQFVSTIVKQALNDSMVQILTPKKRVDILRDVYDAQRQKRPYVIVFCGVNGVGKSTNLAKVTFWLIENSFKVLVAACDTFRSGAVEQLRTHTRHLNALHPPENHNGRTMVELYEKGYGKDPASIAHDAISQAKDSRTDVVLVDTAGRMQDNEPLMKALAKLININQPDLVLFVGEALVGNEAVDQVQKFNQALIDHSSIKGMNLEGARTIDGILLTKFDTIDDKVGAAISMTYTTGQPIVFVGTGQTYSDLKSLNAQSVVQSLLK